MTMRFERWRYSLPLWLRGLFRRPSVEREVDEEIRDHIELATAANIAGGMPADDARRAALVAFGGVERIKDESRDARRLSIIDSIAQLRFAARSLSHARVFTVATVATIALAIGAGSAMLTLLNTILLRPLPYPESDRLVGVWHSFPGMGMALVPQSPGTYLSYRKSARSFESIGLYAPGLVTVNYDDPSVEPERVRATGVTGSIFSMLRARAMLGRLLTDADDAVDAPRVAVVGETFWRSRMHAAPDVVGHRIRVDGEMQEIVGVVPASFAFPGSDVRLWLPIRLAPGNNLGSFGIRAIGRLRPGISRAVAQTELQAILMHVAETYPEVNPGMSTVQALAKTRAVAVVHDLHEDAIGGFERILWLVAAIVAVLVIVAFSNVASLVLARADARSREFAVRRTLGASAARIWGMLLTEAATVSVVGAVAGTCIAAAALTVLRRTGPTEFPDPRFANGGVPVLPRLDEVHLDWTLAMSVLALTAAFCVMIGFIGTWRAMSSDAGRVLREGGRSGTSGRASQRLRAAFVIVEVALSLVLLSGSAVLGRSMLRILDVRPGFDPANVITFWTAPSRLTYRDAADVARFYRETIDRVARMPDVAAVGIVSKPPLEFAQTRRIVWVENAPPSKDALPPDVAIAEASDGYFRAMGIPVVAGRVFDPANVKRGASEAVVSRGFVIQNWGDSTGTGGLGRRFRPIGNVGPWYTIVGVVGDVRDTSLTTPAIPEIYLPEEPGLDSITQQRTLRNMAFVVRTRGPAIGIPATLRRAIRAIDPSLPIEDLAFMTETMAKSRSRMTLALLLLAVGSAATLALGVVGLYGVIAYVVGLRSREIGIRIALGLAPDRAARMILQQGERIVVAGAVIGVVVFVAFAKLLSSLAFDVSVVDRAALGAAAAVVFLVATLATWLPARRAARIDPAEALKSD